MGLSPFFPPQARRPPALLPRGSAMALRLRVGWPSIFTPESLEWRRMLSAPPVGVDDAYDLGPDHRLSVDVAAPPGLAAFDLSEQPPSPAPGPFTIPEFMLTLEHGQR